jgi:hypothetical protein
VAGLGDLAGQVRFGGLCNSAGQVLTRAPGMRLAMVMRLLAAREAAALGQPSQSRSTLTPIKVPHHPNPFVRQEALT